MEKHLNAFDEIEYRTVTANEILHQGALLDSSSELLLLRLNFVVLPSIGMIAQQLD